VSVCCNESRVVAMEPAELMAEHAVGSILGAHTPALHGLPV
jgi:hypothetical protein